MVLPGSSTPPWERFPRPSDPGVALPAPPHRERPLAKARTDRREHLDLRHDTLAELLAEAGEHRAREDAQVGRPRRGACPHHEAPVLEGLGHAVLGNVLTDRKSVV